MAVLLLHVLINTAAEQPAIHRSHPRLYFLFKTQAAARRRQRPIGLRGLHCDAAWRQLYGIVFNPR
ncbi:hypothetical protein D3C78_936790 [compost metagenome]